MKILSSDYIEEINVNELDYEYVNGDITMCEMSPNETKFLLYLLKTKDPKKNCGNWCICWRFFILFFEK